MPHRLLTTAELRTLSSYFEFLATVPYLKVEDPAFQDDCPICKEPFQGLQTPGETLDRPVRLSCGHIFGLQCLARWMFSTYMDGHCSYCRAIIVDPTRAKAQHPVLTATLTNLEILGLFQGHISAERKTELLSIFRASLESRRDHTFLDHARLLMLWEELLESMCDEPTDPEPVRGNDVRAPLVNQGIAIAQEPPFRGIIDRQEFDLIFFCIRWAIVFAIESVILLDQLRGPTREGLLDILCTIRDAHCLFFLAKAIVAGIPLPVLSSLTLMLMVVLGFMYAVVPFALLKAGVRFLMTF